MATVTSLGFSLTSKWDGSGVRDARNDLAQLYTELQAIERTKINIQAEADTANALRQLNEAAEDRESLITAVTDRSSTAAADSHLNYVARDRTAHINVDTDRSIRGLNFLSQAFLRTGHSATQAGILSQKGLTFGQLAAVGFVGAINLIGPAASLASSIIATTLPMGMVAAAAVILRNNEEIKAGWESLANEGAEIFTRSAEPMIRPLVQAMEQLKVSLRGLEPAFREAFANTAPLVEPMTRGITNFAETLMPRLAEALAGMGPLMESFARSGEVAGTRLGNMFKAMGDNAVGLGMVWEVTLNRIFEFVEIIGTRGAQMAAESAVMIDGILGGINSLFDGFLRGVDGMLELGGTAMASTWQLVGSTLGDAFAKVLPPLGELVGAISLTLLPLIEIIIKAWADFAAATIEALIPAVVAAAPVIVAVAQGFDEMTRFLIPLITYIAPVVAGMRLLTFTLTAIALMSPVAYVIKTIGAALSALAAHPVIAVLLLAGGIYYLATETQFFQNTWERFAPGWLKRPFEEGEEGTSAFSRGITSMREAWDRTWESLKRGFDNLKGLFGDNLSNTWKSIKEGFTDAWDSVSKALEGLGPPLKALWAEIVPLAKVLGAAFLGVMNVVWDMYNGMIKPIITFLGDILAAVIKMIEGLINIISGAIRTIRGIFETIYGFGQVLVGFFTGNEELFNKGWETISKGLENIIHGIGNMVRGVLQIVRGLWDTIYSFFKNGIQAVVGVVWGFITGIIDFFYWLWDVLVGHSIIPDTINAIIKWFKELPGKVWEIVRNFIGGVINFFKELATNVINTVTGWIGSLWNLYVTGLGRLRDFWVGLWNGIRDFAIGVWNFIKDQLSQTLEFYKNIWTTALDWIKGRWEWLWNTVRDFAVGVWNFVRDQLNQTLEGWKSIWTTALDWIKGRWEWLWNSVRDFVIGAWNFIRDQFNQTLEGWKNIWNAALDWIKSRWEWLWNTVRDFAVNAWNFIKDQFNQTLEGWKNIWNTALEWIKSRWEWLWNTIRDFAINAWNFIKDQLNQTLEGWKGIWDAALNWVKDRWSAAWNWVRDTAQNVWDNIKQRFEDFKNGVVSTIESLVQKVEEVWNRITSVFEKPIRGIKGLWNGVAGIFGLQPFAEGGEVQGFYSGGAVGGHGGPRDDKVPAMLSRGEHVMTAAEVDAAGGHDAVYSLRRELVAGKQSSTGANQYSLAFAEGGPVEWMWARVRELQPRMQLTSSYRSTNDHHGGGKAIDVSNGSDSTPEMRELTRQVHDMWGRDTLELIHSPSMFNIKDGRGVGDGMSFYGSGTMSAHRNHVHWAVPRPLDGRPGAPIGGAGGYSGPSPEQIAAHKRATDEIRKIVNQTNAETVNKQWGMTIHEMNRAAVGEFIGPVSATELNRAAQNVFGMYAPAGDTHGAGTHKVGAGAIGKLDAALASATAAIGGVIPEGERRAIIEAAMRATNTPPPSTHDAWLRGMNTLITRESNWNPGAVNNSDINAQNGTPSRGLAQVIQPTFNAHQAPGMGNINDPVHNVAASINYIKSRYGTIENVQQANASMPPKGYYEGTPSAAAGWAVVGEKGPEAVRFRGGEQVKSFDDIIRELKERASGHSQELVTKLEAEVAKAISAASAEQKATATELIGKLETEIARAIDQAMSQAQGLNSEIGQKVASEVRAGIEHLASLVGIQINIPTSIGDGVNDGREIIDAFKSQVVPQLEMALRQQIGRR